MDNPNRNRQLGCRSSSRLMSSRNTGWPCRSITDGKSSSSPEIQTGQTAQQVVSREQTGHHLILPPIGTGQAQQLELNPLNAIETVADRTSMPRPRCDPPPNCSAAVVETRWGRSWVA